MPSIRKHTQNVIIDLISFICMVILLTTGIIMYYSLPPGSHGQALMGLTRHQWGDIHFWTAVVFITGITIHLILHGSWIKASFLPKENNKLRKAILVLLISICAFFLLALGLLF